MNKYLFWCISIILLISCIVIGAVSSNELVRIYPSLDSSLDMSLYSLVFTIIFLGIITLDGYKYLALIYGIFLITCLIKTKKKKINFSNFFLKKKQPILNFVKILTYLVILFYTWLYSTFQFDIPYFMKYHFLFYLLLIINTVIFTLWITHIFRKQPQIPA
jgi:hypothetical protein